MWGFIVTLLAALVASLTKLIADALADWRRVSREHKEATRQFARVEAAMPVLLEEMRTDLSQRSSLREGDPAISAQWLEPRRRLWVLQRVR